MFNLNLFDLDIKLVNEWKDHFYGFPVGIIHSNLDDIIKNNMDKNICVVSPANSYGFMDGGIDGAISRICNNKIADIVREDITTNFGGELLVGQATINWTNTIYNKRILVCSAPTMRVPYSLVSMDNIYCSFFSVLQKMIEYSDFITFCPGLGTGAGGVSPTECARQMRLAYDNFHKGIPKNWEEAIERQHKLGVM